MERFPTIIVGAGQAGLSLSHELSHAGEEHVLLDRGKVAQSWRSRWDSFTLVTPNWTMRLPGGEYDGDDPDGFMPRDHIVDHIERYARSFSAPVREGVSVSSLRPYDDGGFLLETTAGAMRADRVVLASGGYQKPFRPRAAADLPGDLFTIDAEAYTSPDALPDGAVLVIGSGQTGCQIAEDLHLTGRAVTLSCGRAPWGPRRIGDRDLVAWVSNSSFMSQTVADLPSPASRLVGNFQATGRDGGHDLHYRVLRDMGVTLTGRMAGVDGHTVLFADDLAESVAFGDARYAEIPELLAEVCAETGEAPPELPPAPPFDPDAPDKLDLRGVGAVIFTSGFRPDYDSWVHFPSAFDEYGFPVQIDGVSTAVPGLFFIGTHFLRKRRSATLFGIAEDAAVVAERMTAGS